MCITKSMCLMIFADHILQKMEQKHMAHMMAVEANILSWYFFTLILIPYFYGVYDSTFFLRLYKLVISEPYDIITSNIYLDMITIIYVICIISYSAHLF